MRKIANNQRQLLQQLEKGDHDCLIQLYENYGAMLYGMLYRQLADEAKAERVLITTFLNALSKKINLDLTINLFNYLFKIAQRLSKNECSTDALTVGDIPVIPMLLQQSQVNNTNDTMRQSVGENLRKELKKFRNL